MSYLDQIIDQQLKDVKTYDPEKYREEIDKMSSKYGVKYTVFQGEKVTGDDSSFTVKSPSKSKIWLIGGSVLLIAATTYFIIKKKRKK